MRQTMMIQDWGFDYLYVRHDHVITRINLKNHSYRDVTYSPVEEFDSMTSAQTDYMHAKSLKNIQQLESIPEDDSSKIIPRGVYDDYYMSDLSPVDLDLEEEWMHVLATVDACDAKIGTKFCDDNGSVKMDFMMITPIVQEKMKVQVQDTTNKGKAKQIHAMDTSRKKPNSIPPARIKVNFLGKGERMIEQLTLIDSTVDVNLMSYELWSMIGRPTLDESSQKVISFRKI